MDRPIKSAGIALPGVVPTLTLANADVAAPAIVMDVVTDFVWTGLLLSRTITAKLNAPLEAAFRIERRFQPQASIQSAGYQR